ncbi:MAG: hypothetical protein WD772_11260 [Pseudohongiellaceae bacterium]
MRKLMTIVAMLSLSLLAGSALAAKPDKVLINHKGREILVAAPAVPHHLRNHAEDFIVGGACEASRVVSDPLAPKEPKEFDADFDITYVVCDDSSLSDLLGLLENPPVELTENGVSYECVVSSGDTPVLNTEFTIRLSCSELLPA